ncbi:MAG: TldD/PmbA family protein [Clostridia bacterium]|nr:TldD/PmbA family protein [Clostridia bacterium]
MKFEEIKRILSNAAERRGLTEYEIYYQIDESISAETLKDEISAFSSGVGGGVCFRCIVNGKMGYASGERMTEEALEEMVEQAISNAACIDSEDEVFLFGGSPSYTKLPAREIALNDAATVRDTALRLQKALYAESEHVTDGTQSCAISLISEIAISNSHGLSLQNRVGMSGAYVNPIVTDGKESQESFEFDEGVSYDELKKLPEKAVQKALEKLGAETVSSGKYDVILDGTQFRQFLATFSPVFSAKQAQHGLSLLAGKEGEVIASPCVTVVDDPMREGACMQTPFDGEGVATARRNVIENGVLKTLLYDLSTAKKAGVASTGNGQKAGYSAPIAIAPYHFSICPGEADDETLFSTLGNGLYVTQCKGFHSSANAVTGDFSIECAGFLIRDGKKSGAIKGFTVAGNFFDLLKQIEAVGNELKWSIPTSFTVFGSPNVLIRNLSVAGK